VSQLSDAHHFRRMVAGWCMVLAPLFLLASAVVSPSLDTDETALLNNVAADMDRWYLSTLLAFVAIILAVPAVLGVMHMLRERRAAEGHVGGALALIGLLAAMAATGASFVVWQMAASGADRGEMAALLDRVQSTAGVTIPVFLLTFGIAVGFVVLAYGLWRAGAAHWSIAGALAVGAIVNCASFPAASVAMGIVGAALVLVGFATLGRVVLTETDEDWEHTPQWRGFRPTGPAAASG